MKYVKTFEGYKELDQVLDKISKKGKDSLTKKEKEFLKDWDIDKELEEESAELFEDGIFKMQVLDILHQESIIFKIKLFYKGKEYIGDVIVKSENPASFYWEIFDYDGNDFEPAPSHFYDLDSLIEEMTDKLIVNENVKNKKKIPDRTGLLPEIKDLIIIEDDKEMVHCEIINKNIELSYSSLLRVLLVKFLNRWKPNPNRKNCKIFRKGESYLTKAKESIIKGKETPYLQALTGLPNNNIFFSKYFKDIVGGYYSESYMDVNDTESLNMVYRWYERVTSELDFYIGFVELFKRNAEYVLKAKESEALVLFSIERNKLDSFKDTDILEVTPTEDKKGMDIHLKKGIKDIRIQVKRVFSKFELGDNYLEFITKIDLKYGYYLKKFDYLILHFPIEKKLVIIESDKITDITKDNRGLMKLEFEELDQIFEVSYSFYTIFLNNYKKVN